MPVIVAVDASRPSMQCGICKQHLADAAALAIHSDLGCRTAPSPGGPWYFRAPPRGLTSHEYIRCPRSVVPALRALCALRFVLRFDGFRFRRFSGTDLQVFVVPTVIHTVIRSVIRAVDRYCSHSSHCYLHRYASRHSSNC